MILSAFLALVYVMPFLTGQIREFGLMLCPFIPVLVPVVVAAEKILKIEE